MGQRSLICVGSVACAMVSMAIRGGVVAGVFRGGGCNGETPGEKSLDWCTRHSTAEGMLDLAYSLVGYSYFA